MYLLSNIGDLHWAHLSREYRLHALGHGALPSYLAGVMKPHAGIYAEAERRFALTPQHTVFIDDRADNIAAACARGWHGIVHADYAAHARGAARARGHLLAQPRTPRKAPVSPCFSASVSATLLLLGSNVFMTFAWYAHLKNLAERPWYLAALASWGIAFFEYLLQVPGNRIGYTQLSLPQLKILQEVITLTVFVPFAVFYMGKPLKLDYLWAGLCILAAVYFVFRTPAPT